MARINFIKTKKQKKEDPIKNLEKLARKINWKKKINLHAIEEEYEERWKKASYFK